MRWVICLGCLSGLALLTLFAEEARAEKKPVKLTRVWKGSVEDAALQKDAPECVTSAKGLEKLWKAWKVPGKVPAVDFKKEIVVLGTTVGSRLNLSARLDDKGNLEVLGLATRDFGPGFRYVLATVSREGVKKVNNKELPKE